MKMKQEGAFQMMCFQSKTHILLPWKSLCFKCQSLFHTSTKIIRLDSHGVNTMELSRFSPENPALHSFLLAPSPTGHPAWPSDKGQGDGTPEDAGTVCKLVPRDCLPWEPWGQASLCLQKLACSSSLKLHQRGASPRENWSFSQKEVIYLSGNVLKTVFISHIHIRHLS